MHVRPFFWCLLVCSCLGALICAALVRTAAPVIMQLQIEQPPRAVGWTTLELHLTDPQGLPNDEAQIVSSARMTSMEMITHQSQVKAVGQGIYIARLHLYMAGPWEITVMAHAEGFASLNQTVLVKVM